MKRNASISPVHVAGAGQRNDEVSFRLTDFPIMCWTHQSVCYLSNLDTTCPHSTAPMLDEGEEATLQVNFGL